MSDANTVTRSIPFARPWITQAERDAVMEVLRGDILTHGPQNKAFEQEFNQFVADGNAHCVAVSSCMAALHLAYMQLGVGPGDEVIVPAQTHVATAHAVELVGAKPIFVDCDINTGNLDPSRLESLITSKTRAISLVHFLGIPCEMNAILDIANRHGLHVIEDCALALGSRFKGKHVGLFGTAGCFSFYPVKHITTGDGGMFITRDATLAEKVVKARGFGVDRTFDQRKMPGIYDVLTLGLNYRMSDINAALGRVQLSRAPEILRRRNHNFDELANRLRNLPNVSILDVQSRDQQSSHYCLSVLLHGPLRNQRASVINTLKDRGVGTSVYYPQPVPRMTYYREKYGYNAAMFPNATAISDQSIALPVGPHLDVNDVEFISSQFVSTVQEFS